MTLVVVDPPKEHGNCPHCNANLDGGGIWNHFYQEFQKTGYWMDENGKYTTIRRILSPEEAAVAADEVAARYGATREEGRWGQKIGESNWDRVIRWHCPHCKGSWDR